MVKEVVDDAKILEKELILFKVNFEKTYDSIKWKYLEDVMAKLWFIVTWMKWNSKCMGSISN